MKQGGHAKKEKEFGYTVTTKTSEKMKIRRLPSNAYRNKERNKLYSDSQQCHSGGLKNVHKQLFEISNVCFWYLSNMDFKINFLRNKNNVL